jgi:hypothetical protein
MRTDNPAMPSLGTLISMPTRMAAEVLDELQGAAIVGAFALADRLEDQMGTVIAVAEHLEPVATTVTGWARRLI